jgi:hypothetical protein
MNLRAIEHNHLYKSKPEPLNRPMPLGSGKTAMIRSMILEHGTTEKVVVVFVPNRSHAEPYKDLERNGLCLIIILNIHNVSRSYGFRDNFAVSDEIQNKHIITKNYPNLQYLGGAYTPRSQRKRTKYWQ